MYLFSMRICDPLHHWVLFWCITSGMRQTSNDEIYLMWQSFKFLCILPFSFTKWFFVWWRCIWNGRWYGISSFIFCLLLTDFKGIYENYHKYLWYNRYHRQILVLYNWIQKSNQTVFYLVETILRYFGFSSPKLSQL